MLGNIKFMSLRIFRRLKVFHGYAGKYQRKLVPRSTLVSHLGFCDTFEYFDQRMKVIREGCLSREYAIFLFT